MTSTLAFPSLFHCAKMQQTVQINTLEQLSVTANTIGFYLYCHSIKLRHCRRKIAFIVKRGELRIGLENGNQNCFETGPGLVRLVVEYGKERVLEKEIEKMRWIHVLVSQSSSDVLVFMDGLFCGLSEIYQLGKKKADVHYMLEMFPRMEDCGVFQGFLHHVGVSKEVCLKEEQVHLFYSTSPKYPHKNSVIPRRLQTEPIKSLQLLQNWKENMDPWNVCHEKKAERFVKEESKQEILVCHDMAGGYRDDRHIQGSSAFHVYNFTNWQYVSTFVYFSHYRVTIPPRQFIHCAHRNGVAILGTFITEHDAGGIDNVRFIDGPESDGSPDDEAPYSTYFADKLVQIANYYNFDGWFVNLEVSLPNEKYTHKLVCIMEYMKNALHQSGKRLIWYDSVIYTGVVKWQNELNHKNRVFFDCSDGIFLNYQYNKEMMQKSSENAGDKSNRVFVGIDCFGRGTYLGGGFNTGKAVGEILANKMSVAIFAPGWTFENDGAGDINDFRKNEKKFWIDGDSGESVGKYVTEMGIPNGPFFTTFNLGQGKRFFAWGAMTSSESWNNLEFQDLLPTCFDKIVKGKHGSMDWCFDDAFYGGNCLRLKGCFDKEGSKSTLFQLFKVNFLVQEDSTLEFVTKNLTDRTLRTNKNHDTDIDIILLFSDDTKVRTPRVYGKDTHYHPFVQIDYENDWRIKKVRLQPQLIGKTITEIRINVYTTENADKIPFDIYLGQMSLFHPNSQPSITKMDDIRLDYKVTFNFQSLVTHKSIYDVHLSWSIPHERLWYPERFQIFINGGFYAQTRDSYYTLKAIDISEEPLISLEAVNLQTREWKQFEILKVSLESL